MRRAERPAVRSARRSASWPATDWIIETSSSSRGDSGGRIEGSRCASIDLPAPGGPIISRLWPPAAAISSARLALSWPLMSRRSGRPSPAGAIAGSGRASTCVPLKWLASWISERGARISISPRGPGRLRPAGRRADQPVAAPVGRHRGRQHAGDRGDRAVERQLAEHGEAVERVGRDRPDRRHDAERDRQVVMAAFLGQVGRGEVDGDALGRQREPGGDQRRAHPLARFGDRLVGEPDDHEGDVAGRDLHLHVDGARLDALEGDRRNARDHAGTPQSGCNLTAPFFVEQAGNGAVLSLWVSPARRRAIGTKPYASGLFLRDYRGRVC